MAATSPTETLIPPAETLTTNGHDSTNQNQTHLPDDQSKTVDQLPSAEVIETGEKRKREDPDPEPESELAKPKSSDQQPEGSVHPLWKTSLCSYFRRSNGSCSHGDTCRYAHGEEELRPRPDNTWDPTSDRAKKLLKSENGERLNVSEAKEVEDEVMMTEAVVVDESSSDSGFAKCLVNLPMKWSSDQLRNFLGEQGIAYKSAKKKKGMVVGFVNFESAEQVKSATEVLDRKSLGNKNLKVADVITRALEKKNKQAVQPMKPTSDCDIADVSKSSNGSVDQEGIDEGLTHSNSELSGRSVRDAVTPLAYMPYADQLEHKKSALMQTFKRLTRNVRKACPTGVSLPEWILKSRDIGGLPCKLEGILGSPLVNGYRNKCEFSVGYSLQGKPTVGFLLGNFREGVTAVEEPVSCPNISRISCKYAAVFQEFLQSSELPIWSRLNNTGFWRQLTVREGRMQGHAADSENVGSTSEVMLIVQVSTEGFDDIIVNNEFEKMSQAFVVGASADPPLPLTSLVIQDHKGISNAAPPDAPLCTLPIPSVHSRSVQEVGKGVEAKIHDYISNLRFCISPTAFFQVNTLAAEKLYSLAGDWAGLGPDTLLFDICCGTGTIGLTLAHRVGMVVGIEMNASAVSDAVRNAEINGITNCRFVCAKAEDVIGSLLKEYLHSPQKHDEISTVPEKNDEEFISTEEKESSVDKMADPEASTGLELENGEGFSKCSENGCEEHGNLTFGTSEIISPSVQQYKNIVAIVDPPRVGLHPIVIKALRTNPRMQRLVYISCNPETLVANAIELCTPSADKAEKANKNNRGWRNMSNAGLARHRAKSMPNSDPFQPIRAMAVDLFPHTPHCELVMLLER